MAVYKEAFTKQHFDVVYPSEVDEKSDKEIDGDLLNFTNIMDSVWNGRETDWVVLMCLSPTDGEHCLKPSVYLNLKPYQKVSRIPGLRNILWKKDALCSTMFRARHMHAFHQSPVSPLCWILPSQLDQFIASAQALNSPQHWVMKSVSSGRGQGIKLLKYDDILTLQESSFNTRAVIQEYIPNQLHVGKNLITVMVYVLVTSTSPLRVYLHEEGRAFFRQPQKDGFSKVLEHVWHVAQFRQYLRRTYGVLTEQKASQSIEQAVVSTLLIAEPLLRNAFRQLFQLEDGGYYQCQHCFQLLSMELMLNKTFHAVVMEVNGQPPLSQLPLGGDSRNSNKQSVAKDVVNLIFGTSLVARDVARAIDSVLGANDFSCRAGQEICLSTGDLVYLLDSKRERQFRGHFHQVYPTANGAVYNDLIADLKSELVDNQHDPGLSGTQSSVDLHNFLTKLEITYQTVSMSHSNSRTNSEDFINPPHKSKKSSYQEALIDNVFGEDSDHHVDGCSDDKSVLPFLGSLAVSQGQLDPPFRPSTLTYHVHVGHEITRITVEAVAAHCRCQARFGTKEGQMNSVKWVLDIGQNVITIFVADISHAEVWILQRYYVYIARAELSNNEGPFNVFLKHQVCSLVQECDLTVFAGKRCGLQLMSESWLQLKERTHRLPSCHGTPEGRWVVPCMTCNNRSSCFWRNSTWLPYDCIHRVLPRLQLRYCWAERKVFIIGDSTIRGVMYYMLEMLNGTLAHWHKSHTSLSYSDLGQHMSFTFAYYPQFWLSENQQPVFERVLYTLLRKHLPLKNSQQTVLIIGGLQWLTNHHINITHYVLKRMGLTDIAVIVKGYGAGFTQPADGIRYYDSVAQRRVLARDKNVMFAANQFGFHYVNTFNMTISRYKHFLYGRCGCHYHLVEAVNNLSSDDERNLDQLQLALKYTVRGDINAFYSELVMNTMCSQN